MYTEFRSFLLTTNALALAIGVIIGVALGTVVASLVADIIMPPIGLLLGGVDLGALKVVLKAASGDQPEVAIRWGTFLNAVITFVMVALVVFLISRRFLPHPDDPATTTCPYCLDAVSADATRCRSCTSELLKDGEQARGS
ncbi:MAG: large conductance mechanosensitive channel protein MscL [Chloroflexi bacterium]|nr:large conductance mechanosensitive channel protein MscL [Chloroflexota bacterium]